MQQMFYLKIVHRFLRSKTTTTNLPTTKCVDALRNQGNVECMFVAFAVHIQSNNRINSWGRRCLFYLLHFFFIIFHFFFCAICLAFMWALLFFPVNTHTHNFLYLFLVCLVQLVFFYFAYACWSSCPSHWSFYGFSWCVMATRAFLTCKIVCCHLKSSIIVKMGFLHTIFNHQSHQRVSSPQRGWARPSKSICDHKIYGDLNEIWICCVCLFFSFFSLLQHCAGREKMSALQFVCNARDVQCAYWMGFLFPVVVVSCVPIVEWKIVASGVTSMENVHRWNNHLGHWIWMKLDINGINLLIVLIWMDCSIDVIHSASLRISIASYENSKMKEKKTNPVRRFPIQSNRIASIHKEIFQLKIFHTHTKLLISLRHSVAPNERMNARARLSTAHTVCFWFVCLHLWGRFSGGKALKWEKGSDTNSNSRLHSSIDWYFYLVFIVNAWWAHQRRRSFNFTNTTIYHILIYISGNTILE